LQKSSPLHHTLSNMALMKLRSVCYEFVQNLICPSGGIP
jgi:hypothetical protein